jgi:hypothetical protein
MSCQARSRRYQDNCFNGRDTESLWCKDFVGVYEDQRGKALFYAIEFHVSVGPGEVYCQTHMRDLMVALFTSNLYYIR